jgi:alpha-N-acetylglucosamine transferase
MLVALAVTAIISTARIPSALIPRPAYEHTPSELAGWQWSDFAYVTYVTNENSLCNSLMLLEALQRFGAKADKIMLFPDTWKVPEGDGSDFSLEGSQFLARARDRYQTKLVPVQLQMLPNMAPRGWEYSYTKLLAFNQTRYKRVIALDSDATLRHVSKRLLEVNVENVRIY